MLLAGCGSIVTTHRNCVPEVTLTSTEEAVIYIRPYFESNNYSSLKLKEGEYYGCLEDEFGSSQTRFCRQFVFSLDDRFPPSTKITFDGLVKQQRPLPFDRAYAESGANFRGHVGDKTIWVSDSNMQQFQSDDFDSPENDEALRTLGLVSRDRGYGVNHLEFPDNWRCPGR